MKVPRWLPTVLVLLFSYNMLTKKEVVEMLASSKEIALYELEKLSVYLWPVPPEEIVDLLQITQKCVLSYEKIIQHILDKLDETQANW